MGIPTVFVGYLTKTRGVLEALGLQQNLLELNDLSAEILSAQLDRLWSEKGQQKEALSVKMDGIIEQLQRATFNIYKDFHERHG